MIQHFGIPFSDRIMILCWQFGRPKINATFCVLKDPIKLEHGTELRVLFFLSKRLTWVSGNFPDTFESSWTHLLSFQITAVTVSPSTSTKHSVENSIGLVFEIYSTGKRSLGGTLFFPNVPKLIYSISFFFLSKRQEFKWCSIVKIEFNVFIFGNYKCFTDNIIIDIPKLSIYIINLIRLISMLE